MSRTFVVRYQTTPETADENQRLIEQVFTQLAAENPDQFRYAALRLADGVSFVHIVVLEGDANPLAELPAFKEFSGTIGERSVEPPTPTGAEIIGSFRFLGD